MPQWRHRKPRPLVHTVEAGLVISKSSYLQTNYEIFAKFRGWCSIRAETNLWEQSFKIGKTKFCLRFKSQKNTEETEAVAQKCSVKKVFLEILQNSQENTYARGFFLIKLQASACNLIKKEALVQLFSSEFYEICKTTFSYRTTSVAASEEITEVELLNAKRRADLKQILIITLVENTKLKFNKLFKLLIAWSSRKATSLPLL